MRRRRAHATPFPDRASARAGSPEQRIRANATPVPGPRIRARGIPISYGVGVTPIARRLSVTAGLTIGAGALVFTVAAPPENCPEITADETTTAAAAAVAWLVDNQNPDGT